MQVKNVRIEKYVTCQVDNFDFAGCTENADISMSILSSSNHSKASHDVTQRRCSPEFTENLDPGFVGEVDWGGAQRLGEMQRPDDDDRNVKPNCSLRCLSHGRC